MSVRNPYIEALRERARAVVKLGLIAVNLHVPDETEYWHVVGASGEVGFPSGWGSYGSPYAPVSFRKDNSGFVHLRGVARGVNVPDGVIFTLPSSWAPQYLTSVPLSVSGMAMGDYPQLLIHANGNVEVDYGWIYPKADTGQVFLDNHRWKAV